MWSLLPACWLGQGQGPAAWRLHLVHPLPPPTPPQAAAQAARPHTRWGLHPQATRCTITQPVCRCAVYILGRGAASKKNTTAPQGAGARARLSLPPPPPPALEHAREPVPCISVKHHHHNRTVIRLACAPRVKRRVKRPRVCTRMPANKVRRTLLGAHCMTCIVDACILPAAQAPAGLRDFAAARI